ncbi:MAG: hypothetical protein R3293_07035 [Candidatus Promineifilaceae bacterium]|nr:hypothetical protein [Candidatus Promineifilaceae bacterium]
MIKKITLITLFILFAGALIAGGVYRTSAKSANETRLDLQNRASALEENQNNQNGNAYGSQNQQQQAEQAGERQGQGLGNGGVPQGRNRSTEGEPGQGPAGASRGQGYQGQNQANQGQGYQGQGKGYQGSGQGRNQQAERAGEVYEEHESIGIEGLVLQAPAAGIDMIVKTADDQEVLVGTGPGYLQEIGFEIAEGDTVQVTGFWEDGEFKVETITRDGETATLRDAYGRPMWSGAARNGRGAGNQGNGGYGQGQQAGS